VYAAAVQAAQHAAEAVELALGERPVAPVARGEVRREPDKGQRLLLHYRLGELDDAFRLEPEPAHAGVDHDVHRQDGLLPSRLGGEYLYAGERVEGGRDAVVHHLLDLLLADGSEYDHGQGDTLLAELDSLGRVADSEHVRARAGEQAAHLHGAVSVRVGLDHAHDGHVLANFPPHAVEVALDSAQVNGRPCPGLFHFLFPLFFCFRLLLNRRFFIIPIMEIKEFPRVETRGLGF
jgi:hypothetical protein